MSAEPSPKYTIHMGFTMQDKLKECEAFLRGEHERVIDRRSDPDGRPLNAETEPDALHALVRLYASFTTSLIHAITTTVGDGPEVHLSPEGRFGFMFYRPGSGAFGSVTLLDGAWRVTE